MPKPPTIEQLLRTIDAYNKAHELDLKHPANQVKSDNSFLVELYFAAAAAAAALHPLMKVELKTKPKA